MLLDQLGVGAGRFIALRVQMVQVGGEPTASFVERPDLGQQPEHSRVAPAREGRPHLGGGASQEPQVDHGTTGAGCRARDRDSRSFG
jgi:hypothetical protein